MRLTRTNEKDLIVAAQLGDRRALDELIVAYLPLVYTIVRRALGAHPDVDDVVQDVMLRALRQLRVLREPESFRAWLAAIAVRQISTHLDRARLAAERTVAVDEAVDVPDINAEVEGVTLLRTEVSAQRRQVTRASQWLDPDDRVLLSLWWLEVAGHLSRGELAAALGVSLAHTGVRVQRMRGQLDLSRSVVAALRARPRCGELSAVVADWDGSPGPLWRKRIARHTRSCVVCTRASDGMVDAERLLIGLALLPVPALLTAALLGKAVFTGAAAGATSAALSGAAGVSSGGAGVGVKAGFIGQLVQMIGAHPVVAAVTAGTLVVGGTVTAATWPESSPPAPTVVAASPSPSAPAPPTRTASSRPTNTSPSVTAGRLALGPVSLESANATGRYAATSGNLGVLTSVSRDSGDSARARATFQVIRGLADASCFAFRAQDGRYLRHSSWRVRLSPDEGTELFRGDATFCLRTGSVAGSVSFESSNYPGWFLRHRGDELWVDHADGSAAFRADSSFLIRVPLAE